METSSDESILVYSKYQGDLPRFKAVLSRALPNCAINYAADLRDAERYFPETTILYGWGFPVAWLRRIPNLRWVQKMGAGVDDIVGDWPSDRSIVLTRTDGRLIAPRMAEYVLAMILDHNLRLDHARQLQRDRAWEFFEMGALSQLTIGVAGLGEIGTEVVRKLRALNCNVVGWRRSPVDSCDVSRLYVGAEQLGDFVSGCDVVVLVLPLTSDTRGIFDGEMLSYFKPGAHLINVGRGGVIDEASLLAALDRGRIARASLDVVGVEPLPRDNPLWSHPGVVLTPHVCGPLIPEDIAPHFVANFQAFRANRPLRNLVDVNRQY